MVYDASLILKKATTIPTACFYYNVYIRHLRMSYVQKKSQEKENVIVLMGGGLEK